LHENSLRIGNRSSGPLAVAVSEAEIGIDRDLLLGAVASGRSALIWRISK